MCFNDRNEYSAIILCIPPNTHKLLIVETMDDAEMIGFAAYDRLTAAEKAANYWQASQDLCKRLPDTANT